MKLVPIPAGEFMMGGTESAEQLVKAFAAYHRQARLLQGRISRGIACASPGRSISASTKSRSGSSAGSPTTPATRPRPRGTARGGWGYNPTTGKCEGRDLKYNWRDPGFPQTDEHPVLERHLERRRGLLPLALAARRARPTGCRPRPSGNMPAARARPRATPTATIPTRWPKIGNVRGRHGPDDVPARAGARHSAGQPAEVHGAGRRLSAEPLRAVRHARQRLGMVLRLVRRGLLRPLAGGRSAGPGDGRPAGAAGRGWNSFPLWARAAFRNWNTPRSRCVNLGFRVGPRNRRPTPRPRRARSRIVFGGDVMLDGGPGHAIVHGTDPFADFADDPPRGRHLRLQSGMRAGRRRPAGPQAVHVPRPGAGRCRCWRSISRRSSVANNHTGDFGPDAFARQLTMFAEAGLPCFGGGRNRQEARRPLILERNGLRIALLGYNGFPPRSFAAGEGSPGVGLAQRRRDARRHSRGPREAITPTW